MHACMPSRMQTPAEACDLCARDNALEYKEKCYLICIIHRNSKPSVALFHARRCVCVCHTQYAGGKFAAACLHCCWLIWRLFVKHKYMFVCIHNIYVVCMYMYTIAVHFVQYLSKCVASVQRDDAQCDGSKYTLFLCIYRCV